jgi:hypothetical protein
LSDGVFFTVYQGRDLLRARHLLEGEWIWHGPEMSGGGRLPGPFFYWLLAIPLAIFGTWQAVMGFMFFLTASAATLFWHFGKKFNSYYSALVLYFIFILASVVNTALLSFWQTSFLFIFPIGIFFLLYKDSAQSKMRLFLAGLLIGLSGQIHFLEFLFGFSAVLVVWFTSLDGLKNKMHKILALLGGIFVTVLPYICWRLAFAKVEGANYFLGPSTAFLRFSTFSIKEFLVKASSGSFYFMVSNEILFLPLVAGWIAYFVFTFSKKNRPLHFSRFLLVSLLLVTPLCFWHADRPYTYRYFIIWFMIFYIFSSQVTEWVLERFTKVSLTVLILIALLQGFKLQSILQLKPVAWETGVLIILSVILCYLTFARLKSPQKVSMAVLCFLALTTHYSFLQKYSDEKLAKYDRSNSDREIAFRQIIDRTGWNYDFFRERAYFVGLRNGNDVSEIYEQNYDQGHPEKNDEFDGVIIVPAKTVPFSDWASLKTLLPAEIYNLASTGQINCAMTETVGRNQICYYKFVDRNADVNLNNLGYPFRSKQEPPLFEVDSKSGVRVVDKDKAVMYENICSNLEAACTIFFQVSIVPKKFVKLRVTGLPLSSPNMDVNPVWPAAIQEMKVQVSCGDKITETSETDLGYTVPGPKFGGPILLAPFEKQIQLGCINPGKIVVRGVHWTNSVDTNFTFKKEPFELEWKRL